MMDKKQIQSQLSSRSAEPDNFLVLKSLRVSYLKFGLSFPTKFLL